MNVLLSLLSWDLEGLLHVPIDSQELLHVFHFLYSLLSMDLEGLLHVLIDSQELLHVFHFLYL